LTGVLRLSTIREVYVVTSRRVWLVTLLVLVVGAIGCAPRYRYTSRGDEEAASERSSEPAVRATLEEAEAAYEQGVDHFVRDEFTAAAPYLEYAISLLSRDIDWSSDEGALSERRILLYKCRYFLERLPAVVQESDEDLLVAAPEPATEPLPSIEIEYNDKVEKWIRYFTGKGRKTFVSWIHRSGKHLEMTERILAEEGLPAELVNLALIESGFNPNAYSRAHAVGMWQFIASTGRIYGLRIDWWVDERRDPVRSCRAAARYLRDLNEALDSWPLALAAYNSGQRCVERAIKRGRTRDYWKLRLPRETRDFVPKFMAACLLTRDPEKYGLDLTFDDTVRYDVIDLEPKTDLKAVARACGVAVSTIKDLNPHLIRGCAPDGKAPYPVRIPAGKLEICRSELARMPEEERLAKSYTSPTLRHTVRRGETLSRIARKYGTTVSTLARVNNISNRHRIKAGQVLLVPGGEFGSYPENPGIHVVRRGETLSRIGHAYKVKIRDLMAWNDLKSPHVIYPGQKIIVSMEHAPRGQIAVHVVKKGDTVSGIADQYRTSTRSVLQANGLTSGDRIYPGQEIRVPVDEGWMPDGQPAVHSVKRGETISSIAERYGTSVGEVLSLNGLGSRDKIYPGQKIRITGTLSSSAYGDPVVHEVRRGETVWSIARRYAVSVDDVLRTNGLRSRDRIYPGQKLTIVGSARSGSPPYGDPVVHEVRRGETVWSIARQYAVSVDDVLRTNGLGSADKIYPGQKITIAAAGAQGSSAAYHTVRKGETITSIARMYSVSVESVLDANGLGTRSRIYPGQKIKLP
jgi:membrane-bound lytic murein transglycosylase D